MIAMHVVFKSFCSYLYALRYASLSFVVFCLLVEMKPVVADFRLTDFIEKKVCKFWIPRT